MSDQNKVSGLRILVWIAMIVAVPVAVLLTRSQRPSSTPPIATAPQTVSRTNLLLVSGRLCLIGQTNGFTGTLVEEGATSLRSRSVVSNGVLHGLSEGWHTNGQLQVSEFFNQGVSHGIRTKWYLNGQKLSEARIVEGKLNGPFRRWHENGVLSEQVEFVADQPQGISLSYFPSGSIKARVVMSGGKMVEQTFWKDGEKQP